MTKRRNDSHSTEYGLWLRDEPSIDSSLGYVATNIDYIWRNYKTGDWMIKKEKRYGGSDGCNNLPSNWQIKMFELIHGHIKRSADTLENSKYHGFYFILEKNAPSFRWGMNFRNMSILYE